MTTRLLDTNIVSYIHKSHKLLPRYLPHFNGYTLAISFQTVGELLEGAAAANWSDKKRRALDARIATFGIYESTPVVTAWWAEIRAVRRSQPIPVADCWIAATAVANKVELVTHNPADFAGIPWLTVVTAAP